MENKPEKFRRGDFNPLTGSRNYFRRVDEAFTREEVEASQYRETVAKTIGLAVYNGAVWRAIFTSSIIGLENLIQ